LGSVKPYFDKFSPVPLSETKYMESTDKATRTQFPKFDLLVLALESNESYVLKLTMAKFKAVLIKFDMHGDLMTGQVDIDGLYCL